MTTILVINALSSLLAALGIAGLWVRHQRRVAAAVRPLYVRARPHA